MQSVRLKWLSVAALLLAAGAGPTQTPQLLREQAWTAPGPTLARDLTRSPGECLSRRSDEIEIGRALFRSPALIGGPAAAIGLSCESCHSDGSLNTRFFLPQLTDRPGHSDTTSEWASATRGDGALNPRPIRDIAGIAGRATLGAALEPSLERFTRGVIEEEFQGARSPDQAFAGVVAYMRALSIRACPAQYELITLARSAEDVRRALAAAEASDAETAPLVLLAARDEVERVAQRLPVAAFASERRRLETLAQELLDMRAGDAQANIAAGAAAWRMRFDVVIEAIAPREAETYFNEAALEAALAR